MNYRDENSTPRDRISAELFFREYGTERGRGECRRDTRETKPRCANGCRDTENRGRGRECTDGCMPRTASCAERTRSSCERHASSMCARFDTDGRAENRPGCGCKTERRTDTSCGRMTERRTDNGCGCKTERRTDIGCGCMTERRTDTGCGRMTERHTDTGCGCMTERRTDTGCVCSTERRRNTGCNDRVIPAPTLAMSYIPMQQWGDLMDCETALREGTLFRELVFPFYPTPCCQRRDRNL